MTNPAFAAHTRSTAFSLTLSGPMADELLRLHKAADLMSRYPWFEPWRPVNFALEETVVDWASRGTVRALIRRGLVGVNHPDSTPAAYHEVIVLTPAGHLTCELLLEAGFEAVGPPLQVPCHPDDRIKVDLGGTTWPTPHDRRLDVMIDEDRPFLSGLREEVPA
jgi:hypothetical protein